MAIPAAAFSSGSRSSQSSCAFPTGSESCKSLVRTARARRAEFLAGPAVVDQDVGSAVVDVEGVGGVNGDVVHPLLAGPGGDFGEGPYAMVCGAGGVAEGQGGCVQEDVQGVVVDEVAAGGVHDQGSVV